MSDEHTPRRAQQPVDELDQPTQPPDAAEGSRSGVVQTLRQPSSLPVRILCLFGKCFGNHCQCKKVVTVAEFKESASGSKIRPSTVQPDFVAKKSRLDFQTEAASLAQGSRTCSNCIRRFIEKCRCASVDVLDSDYLNVAAIKTHVLSNLIDSSQLFVVRRSPELKERLEIVNRHSDVLGIRVASASAQRPNHGSCSTCGKCSVCLDRYLCNCEAVFRYGSTNWCSHIHVLHSLTKGLLHEDVELYIHRGIRFTAMRHLRAHIMGPSFMSQVNEHVFEETLPNVVDNEKHRVTKVVGRENDCTCETQYKCEYCKACKCQYRCTCSDYMLDGETCLHLHNVCMKVEVDDCAFERSVIDVANSVSTCYAQPNIYQTNRVQLMIEYEHQQSFSFFVEKEEEASQADSNMWNVVSLTENGEEQVECRIRVLAKANCQCAYYRCTRCEICCHGYYESSCSLDNEIICRHIHAVHRVINSAIETRTQAEDYIAQRYDQPAIYAGFGSVSVGHAGAEHSATGVSLPALTD